MSSIFTSSISGMNAIQDLIKNTISKMNNPKIENQYQVFVENNVDSSIFNPGVQSHKIFDEYNNFLTEEKQQNYTKINKDQKTIEQLLKLEDLLKDKSDVFSTKINELYHQIHTDISVNKNTQINESIAQKLSNVTLEIKDFDKKISFLEDDIKNCIQNDIDEANEIVEKIGQINEQLECLPTPDESGQKKPALMQREFLENELQKIIGVKIIKSGRNYDICFPNGKNLVHNTEIHNIYSITHPDDPKYISIGYVRSNTPTLAIDEIEPLINDGSLGALFKFKREDLVDTRNKIGQLSVNFVDSINSYHMLGYDKNGKLGEQIFQLSNPDVISKASSVPARLVSAKWSSTSNAQASDYQVVFQNNSWIITRLSDNQVIQPTRLSQDHNYTSTSITFDGITLKINDISHEGDCYQIKPYTKILDQIKVISNPNTPFAFSSTNNIDQMNRNNALILEKLNEDALVNKTETLDEAYKNFIKSIVYKRKTLEKNLAFKEKIVDILHDKKDSMSVDIKKQYEDLTREKKSYDANTKIFKVAEKILENILSAYS